MVTYQPELAWAVAWSNGHPRPFILTHLVGMTRQEAIHKFLTAWSAQDAPNRSKSSWRRAYRQGARCIRVVVRQFGDIEDLRERAPDADLVDWEDLRGRAPDATGSLSSEAFIREERDAWEAE